MVAQISNSCVYLTLVVITKLVSKVVFQLAGEYLKKKKKKNRKHTL
jgi:hypothetical protein